MPSSSKTFTRLTRRDVRPFVPRGTSDWRGVVLDQLIERDGEMCYLCGKDLERNEMQIDHIIPVSLYGEHVFSNLAISCDACNGIKQNRLVFFDVLVRRPVFFVSPVRLPVPILQA